MGGPRAAGGACCHLGRWVWGGAPQWTLMELSAAPNPDWAAEALARLDGVALPEGEGARRRLAVLLGTAPAAADLLAARPALVHLLEDGDLPPWSAADAAGAAAALRASGEAGWAAAAQREGLLRVALRDLTGLAATDRAAGELADLADGVLSAALETATEDAGGAGAGARVAVLAMGKLGGRELNYVSDVDVLFVHDGDAAAAERIARGVLQLAGGHGPHGAAYEVDANLRPEGRNGPLSRSLDSYRAYYGRWAKTWEFQALLKARPLAGPADLLADFAALVEPFVWPTSLGADAVAEIQGMKARVERSRPVLRHGERELKLGPGGLRDIEFAVQLLQLVHGPADPAIRQRGTLPALAALAEGGYVDEGDANLFAGAYLFLRTVEHRLQLRQLRRTHTLPDDEDGLQHLARACGFRDLPVRPARAEFEKELVRVRAGVRRLHEQLFYRPLLATIASWDEDVRVGRRMDAEAVTRRLHALAFRAPGQAVRHLEALVRGSDRTARQLRVVLPGMLEGLAATPDPDAGLAALRDLAEELRHNPRFLRTLRDNLAAAHLLARVLGTSPRLGRQFAGQPEALRLLDEPEALARARSREELHGGVTGLLRRSGGRAGVDALRRATRREVLRTALRVVTDEADAVRAGLELTWLAEGVLDAAVASALEDAPGVRLAVVGLGRLGAGELALSSDLDVLFVHDGDTAAAEGAAEAVVELLGAVVPAGDAFRVDPGLRPEGRQGPLSRSLDSHRAYYERWAGDWELLAMTQARPVAGDRELGGAFVDLVQGLVYVDPVPAERLVAVRTMKARLERERAGQRGSRAGAARLRPAPGPRRGPGQRAAEDLKLGPGGLSDVEWTAQLLGMVHGAREPAVRGPGTLRVLAALREAGHLTAEEAAWLEDGWRLLSTVRNALHLVGERDTSLLPSHPDARRRLAAALHLDSAQALSEQLDRARRRIRKVVDRRFFTV
jgi:[glutamine synthetase] adenylyltransferase / [glutamine synthetase]-adenylyl-L-tyrosine phosphorylase